MHKNEAHLFKTWKYSPEFKGIGRNISGEGATGKKTEKYKQKNNEK